jgi:raffinose/stachyose/melibiose transport system permease protein
VVPALLAYAFVILVPSVQGAGLAFTDWNGLSPDRDFVGFENFVRLAGDPAATGALGRTVLIAISSMILINVVGLALALALNTRVKSRNILRTIFFAPAVISPLVVGYVFKFVLSPVGPVNGLFAAIGLPQLKQNWLGEPTLALWSIIAVVVWQSIGTAMVIYLAGLQGVEQEQIEAAMMDGAGAWQRFRNIILPSIAPAVVINSMLTLISGLRVFDQVYAMTGGGPVGLTQTLATLFVELGFEFGRYGYAAALAVVLSILVAVFSAVQYGLMRRGGRA